ncbi:helix-turn-helix transcriptional regulator [Candidatus Poribacteria bacterium]|nr:helix-turn-helix transcriptional regulator [Candidatus Poribacteria bacterium]
MNYKELKSQLLSNPEVREVYDQLEPTYQLVSSIIKRRSEFHLTQKELAARLGTTQSSISRLESLAYRKPSLSTLQRVAEALESQLVIQLKPKRELSVQVDETEVQTAETAS